MRVVKRILKVIWNLLLVLSVIVNVILVIVLLGAALLIFDIKNNIAQPLVNGLHSSFVGLSETTIDWTIPVRDSIPVVLNIPLETDTVVTLTQPVPLSVSATINLPGVGVLNNAQVNLQLPAGLQLPVHLNLQVPVEEDLDIALDVRAVIPLQETQINDPVTNLRLLFEPLARGLTNLPNGFNEVGPFISDVLDGSPPNLLAENDYSRDPWPGFSQTAGLNYTMMSEPMPATSLPVDTGIVAMGGIPALDEQLRPDVYQRGSPEEINVEANAALQAQGVPPETYNGDLALRFRELQLAGGIPSTTGSQPTGTDTGTPPTTSTGGTEGSVTATPVPGDDLGILPPEGGGAP